MASKHAKLKLALTRAIIDFFLQEDLYADELKIQGTLCVTADRSAIFVTQITETVNEVNEGPTKLPSRHLQKPAPGNGTFTTSQALYNSSSDFGECPEDLTYRPDSGLSLVNRQPPAAHSTKNHTPSRFKSSLGCITSPPPQLAIPSLHNRQGTATKSEPWPLPLQKPVNNVGSSASPSVTRSTSVGQYGGTLDATVSGLSLLDSGEARSETFFTLNSAILNAAAKSAIERLTNMGRENDHVTSSGKSNQSSWSMVSSEAREVAQEVIHGGQTSGPERGDAEVMDCSSAKKRRFGGSSQEVTTTQEHQAASHMLTNDHDGTAPGLKQCTAASSGLGVSGNKPDEEPLMLVTPKRERLSDDECDVDANSEALAARSVKTKSDSGVRIGLTTSASCESSPRNGHRKLHSPPLTQSTSSGCLSPWSFSVASMKEEPASMSVSDWSSADWMRKPRTKFSQEQLHALETEYKNDPFLSTSADKRAELARRLSITEKNVQIWFQNQRRRRRAAAYSQMHYTLGTDAQGADSQSGTESKSAETQPTPALVSGLSSVTLEGGATSPETGSEEPDGERGTPHGEHDENCSPEDEPVVKRCNRRKRVTYGNVLPEEEEEEDNADSVEVNDDDSSSSGLELVIATDSPSDSPGCDEGVSNPTLGSSKGSVGGEHKCEPGGSTGNTDSKIQQSQKYVPEDQTQEHFSQQEQQERSPEQQQQNHQLQLQHQEKDEQQEASPSPISNDNRISESLPTTPSENENEPSVSPHPNGSKIHGSASS